MKAYEHACYAAALAQAVHLVEYQTSLDFCAAVYIDKSGAKMYVRPAADPQPLDTHTVAIAQRWDGRTVQLRFDGGHSEFRSI